MMRPMSVTIGFLPSFNSLVIRDLSVTLIPQASFVFRQSKLMTTDRLTTYISSYFQLLARAVAHHTECTFIRVSGSELVQKFIGEGSRMVRELFVMAREHAPSIIFMDEIDSIGSARIESGGGGDSEVQRTMLELLNQLDGFEATKNIKVTKFCEFEERPLRI